MLDLLRRIDANKQKIASYHLMQEPLLTQLRAYYRIGLTLLTFFVPQKTLKWKGLETEPTATIAINITHKP